MSDLKHTKGEWKVGRNGMYVFNNVSDDPLRNFTIVQCGQIGIPTDEAEANAKLIASAPELLKQLKRALHFYGRGFEPKEGAEDTIGSKLYVDIDKAIKGATL